MTLEEAKATVQQERDRRVSRSIIFDMLNEPNYDGSHAETVRRWVRHGDREGITVTWPGSMGATIITEGLSFTGEYVDACLVIAEHLDDLGAKGIFWEWRDVGLWIARDNVRS